VLLYQIAGLSAPPPTELTEEQHDELQALLVVHASQAISAGVALGPGDWRELDQLERAAWGVAARRVHVQHVCEFLQAQIDPMRAAELYGEVDGGQVHDDMALDRVMQVSMLAMGGGR